MRNCSLLDSRYKRGKPPLSRCSVRYLGFEVTVNDVCTPAVRCSLLVARSNWAPWFLRSARCAFRSFDQHSEDTGSLVSSSGEAHCVAFGQRFRSPISYFRPALAEAIKKHRSGQDVYRLSQPTSASFQIGPRDSHTHVGCFPTPARGFCYPAGPSGSTQS